LRVFNLSKGYENNTVVFLGYEYAYQ